MLLILALNPNLLAFSSVCSAKDSALPDSVPYKINNSDALSAAFWASAFKCSRNQFISSACISEKREASFSETDELKGVFFGKLLDI